MTDDQIFLSTLAARAHIGQLRIHTILNTAIHTQLRTLLLIQAKEYSALETRIHTLAASRGIELRSTDPFISFLSCRLLKLRFSLSKNNAPAVSYMIHSCTQGMIDSLKVLHRCLCRDCPVGCLAQRLLDCERACIAQLHVFL